MLCTVLSLTLADVWLGLAAISKVSLPTSFSGAVFPFTLAPLETHS